MRLPFPAVGAMARLFIASLGVIAGGICLMYVIIGGGASLKTIQLLRKR